MIDTSLFFIFVNSRLAKIKGYVNNFFIMKYKYTGSALILAFCFLVAQSFAQTSNFSFWKSALPGAATVQFTLASQSVREETGTAVSLTVTLSAAQATSTTVPYVVSGTAVYGVNHVLDNGSIVFPIGVTSKTLNYTILDDGALAGNKTVVITLNPGAPIVAGATSVNTVTILDKTFDFVAGMPGSGAISVNTGTRTITVTNMPSGVTESFTLTESGSAATGFSCTGVPSSTVTISGGVLTVDMGVQASAGTISLSCTDSNGALTINLNYLPALLRQVSTNPFLNGSDNHGVKVSAGNEWLGWEGNGNSISPFTQVILRNLATGAFVFPATLDGTPNTMPKSATCCVSFGGDAKKVYFQSTDSIFSGANGKWQVYSKDLTNLAAAPVLVSTTDGTTAVSHDIGYDTVSPDGSTLFFDTASTNLGANGIKSQVFAKSLTNLASPPVVVTTTDGTTLGTSSSYVLGSAMFGGTIRVAIQSTAANFTSGNGSVARTYYKDMNNLNATPVLVSTTDGTTTGTTDVYPITLSPNGTKIMLRTASAAWPGANGNDQVYEKDLTNLTLAPKMVSSVDGTVAGNSLTFEAAYNVDGTRALIRSYSSNFPAGNITNSVFVKNLTDFTISPVLASGVDATTLGNSYTTDPFFASDNKIYFVSMSTNFPNTNGGGQVFQKDYLNLNSAPVLMSGLGGAGKSNTGNFMGFPKFSSDGTKAIFEGAAGNFQGLEMFKAQVYMRNLTGSPAAPVLISTDNGTNKGNADDYFSGIGMGSQMSPDGTKIAFNSAATSFANSPGGGSSFIYYKDLTNMTSNLVHVTTTNGTTAATGSSYRPRFSPNSQKVVFYSSAGNFTGSNGSTQIYTKDLTSLTTAPVLISTTDGTTAGSGNSSRPDFSSDGTKIIFYSTSANFAGGNGALTQVYYKDLTNLTSAPVLVSSTNGTTAGTGSSSFAVFSADATKVLFQSNSANFAGGNGTTLQIYYKDMTNLTLPPVLVSSLDGTVAGTGDSLKANWAPNGTKIVFQSKAPNFPGAIGGNYQIYTKTLASLTSAPRLVSTADGIIGGTNTSKNPAFSPDSSSVIFESFATEFPMSFSGQSEVYIGVP